MICVSKLHAIEKYVSILSKLLLFNIHYTIKNTSWEKGDPTSINNYRPVSLLPALSKIFERVIYNQINKYFTLNNLCYEGKYGFRSKHSTELAALDIIDTITSCMEKGNIPITIYVDLSKAFDTLNYTIIPDKLKFYGIQGCSLNLIENYLKQGSISGLLLFIIYMNDTFC